MRLRDGSRLGQSAALEVSTRAWRAVMERRRSGRRTDEMDADGMEQKPNTRNAGRDEWVGGGRTRRRRRRESRDRAVCSGKRVLVLRVGLAEEEWRPQGGGRGGMLRVPSGGKRRIGKLRCSSRSEESSGVGGSGSARVMRNAHERSRRCCLLADQDGSSASLGEKRVEAAQLGQLVADWGWAESFELQRRKSAMRSSSSTTAPQQ